jgi:hypothetical protein
MDANPKDLYLYLFQLGMTIFLFVSAGLSLLFFRSYGSQPTQLPQLLPFGLVCLIFGVLLSVVAIVEARRMSVKNIDKTRAIFQANIDDAVSKLGTLAGVVSPTPDVIGRLAAKGSDPLPKDQPSRD